MSLCVLDTFRTAQITHFTSIIKTLNAHLQYNYTVYVLCKYFDTLQKRLEGLRVEPIMHLTTYIEQNNIILKHGTYN